jgi:hypothetical protein
MHPLSHSKRLRRAEKWSSVSPWAEVAVSLLTASQREGMHALLASVYEMASTDLAGVSSRTTACIRTPPTLTVFRWTESARGLYVYKHSP